MSTCIQLGLSYMLHEVESELKPGDTVVVVPEYEHWIADRFYGTKYLLMLPALIPQSVFWIAPGYCTNAATVNRLISDFTSVTQKRVRLLMPLKTTSKDPDESEAAFRYSGFNERGDYVAHLDLPRAAFDDRLPGFRDISHPDRQSIKSFNRIADRIQERGARIIVLPPVTPQNYHCSISKFGFLMSKLPKLSQSAIIDARIWQLLLELFGATILSLGFLRFNESLCQPQPSHRLMIWATACASSLVIFSIFPLSVSYNSITGASACASAGCLFWAAMQ